MSRKKLNLMNLPWDAQHLQELVEAATERFIDTIITYV